MYDTDMTTALQHPPHIKELYVWVGLFLEKFNVLEYLLDQRKLSFVIKHYMVVASLPNISNTLFHLVVIYKKSFSVLPIV